MSYQEALRAAFETSQIKRIAIVDDAYDLPRHATIKPERLGEFEAGFEDAVDEDSEAASVTAVCAALALAPDAIPDKVRSDDEALGKLWELYRGAERETPVSKLLRPLFVEFDVDRRDKRRQLESLEALIEDASGIVPERFDSQAQATDLVTYELVFLDFYLEPPGGLGELGGAGRERSIVFLKELIKASANRTPLVMLISSEAKADDLETFREEAEVLASAIQFLPKKQVELDPFRAQGVLLGLVARRREVEALWELLDHWKTSVRAASSELLDLVRQLDLTDYSYLQEYRLNNERIPLSAYLIWLFNGYLADRVEERFRDNVASKLVEKIASKATSSGRVAPTPAIASLYGAVTASAVQAGSDAFKPIAWAGDIFLGVERYDIIFGRAHGPKPPPLPYPMPDVLGIITPACDLVPGRSSSDSLKTVTALGGTLVPLSEVKSPTVHFIVINKQPFHIEWNAKWPVTIPVEQLNGESAFEGRYLWVGRIREPYHADLQQTLVRQVGRIGLPVVPTMPQSLGVRIMVRGPDRAYRVALERRAEERCAWSFQTTKGERVYHLREDVAWLVRDWVKANRETFPDEHQGKLASKVETSAFVSALQEAVMIRRDTHEFGAASVRIRIVDHLDGQTGKECEQLFVVYLGRHAPAAASTDAAGEVPKRESAVVNASA
ncbi:hypothetical protein ACLBX9_07175 [Methylobacterium sp. A49B]